MEIGDAWEFYGIKNGAGSLTQLIELISRNRGEHLTLRDEVGCLILSEPHFFPKSLWIDQPRDWSRNTVQGAFYDMDDGEGARVWAQVSERLGALMPPPAMSALEPVFGGIGNPAVFLPRLGQGTFRRLVLSAYGNRCAITGERAIPVVDAAHIVEFSTQRRHEISNGIALRADIHKLFDQGYVSVRPDFRFVVSKALWDEFENGKVYYELEEELSGREIRVPSDPQLQPKAEYLERHYQEVFRR
jgi:putative restriction endonuclease